VKNVTISLDEEVASWARIEAAKAGKSLSRYIGDRLSEEMRREGSQRAALERFLSAPGWPGITENLPSREELYAERLFHRHEHSPVRAGSESAGKAKKSRGMGKRARA
jgi:hypothetical protein